MDPHAAKDVHITPGHGLWKLTSSRSATDWTWHDDTSQTENANGISWKQRHIHCPWRIHG